MKAFNVLIDRMNAAAPDERSRIEATIREHFEVERAVFALDMSGFSLTVRRDGILPYLGMIRRMQCISEPIVRAHGGDVVKQQADNIMAVFADVDGAVRAGLAINRELPSAGGDRPVQVSIGIDFGRMIYVPGADCFGDPVNTAYKLGEDIAGAAEVLMTERARARLGAATLAEVRIETFTLSIAGIEIPAARVSTA